jgi:hypothetical protein
MLTPDERSTVAKRAVDEAEIQRRIERRTWRVEVGRLYDHVATQVAIFVEERSDAVKVEERVERTIARLQYRAEEWKKLALAHGCPESEGPDCG